MKASAQIHVVVNPVSGRRARPAVLPDLLERINRAGWSAVVQETRGPGDALAAATAACRQGARALVIFGGDGTINEAVSGMEGQGVPIVIAPCGTENVLAKHLGLRCEVPLIWNAICDGRERLINVPMINGRRFLLMAGIGFDADIVRRLAQRRRGHISYATYLLPAFQALREYSFPVISVEVDDAMLFEGPGLVFVGNVPRYALGIRLWPTAQMDDGLLDVAVLPCRGVAGLLSQAARAILTKRLKYECTVQGKGRRVRVWSKQAVPLQVDGDPAGWLPAEFEMTNTLARILV